jgi:hypothetical protein
MYESPKNDASASIITHQSARRKIGLGLRTALN